MLGILRPLGSITITANSTPDQPEKWGCGDWMFWHQQLDKTYGRTLANQKFLHEWEKQWGLDYEWNFCKYQGDFVRYFASKGLDMNSIFSKLINGGSKVVSSTLDTVDHAVDTVGNTVKTTKYLVPVALTGAVLLIGYLAYTRSGQVMQLAKNLTQKHNAS